METINMIYIGDKQVEIIPAYSYCPNNKSNAIIENVVFAHIANFVETIHQHIHEHIYFVTGTGDNHLYYKNGIRASCGGCIPNFPDNIITWYSTNLNFTHKKAVPLPLGILKNDIIAKYSNREKIYNKIYTNFNIATNPRNRAPILEMAKNNPVYHIQPRHTDINNQDVLSRYYDELSQFTFAICPQGNGIDTYRMWECLYLKTIPIVQRSKFVEYFEDKLPIFIADDLASITSEDLERIRQDIQHKTYDYNLLDFRYYKRLLKLT